MANKNNKDIKQYKCINFGACAKADSNEIIKIDAIETLGGIPECPCCHQHTLEEVVEKGFPTKLVGIIAAAVVLVAGLGIGAYFLFSKPATEPVPGGEKGGKEKVDTVKPEPETPPQEILIEQLSIAEGDFTLTEGESKQLTATAIPEKNDEQLTWSSGNEAVATVDANGNVTAVKEGSAAITIAASKSAVNASVNVTVKKKQTTEGPKSEIERYGNYAGSRKNGLPDGTGKVTFFRAYRLNAEYTAQPGEYIQGIFENGKPSFVTYYQKDGTVTKIKLH